MHDDSIAPVPATEALPALDRQGPFTCHDTEELMALGMGCDLGGRTQEAFEVHVQACESCRSKLGRFKQALAPLAVIKEAEATTVNARDAADLWASIHSRIADSVREGKVVDHGLRAIPMPSRRNKAAKVHAIARARRFNRGAAAAAVVLTFGLTVAVLAQTGVLDRAMSALNNWAASNTGNGAVAVESNDAPEANVVDERNDAGEPTPAPAPIPERIDDDLAHEAIVEGSDADFSSDVIPHGATPATPRRAPGMTAMQPEVPAGGVPFASPRGVDPGVAATMPPVQFGRAQRGSLRPSDDGDGLMMDF